MELNRDNVLFLCHFDGADEAQAATDSSKYARSLIFRGNAELDTAQKVFGSASLYTPDDSVSNVYSTDATDLNIGTGDFTIDTRVRFAVLGGSAGTQGIFGTVVQTMNEGKSAIAVYYQEGIHVIGVRIGDTDSGWDASIYTFSFSPVINTWYHIAITRASGTMRAFVDGTQIGSNQSSSDNVIDTFGLECGDFVGNVVNGWTDEVRFSNNAEWTSNFTPPSSPYTISEPSLSRTQAIIIT